MMCSTSDEVLYIELVAELSVNITFKQIIVQLLVDRCDLLTVCFMTS